MLVRADREVHAGAKGVNLLLSAWTIGAILSLLAVGTYVSFRIFHFPDITVDGSLTLGAAMAAVLIVHGHSAVWATLAGAAAGVMAGVVTGVLHTRFGINKLLSGILRLGRARQRNPRRRNRSRN
jgi:putative tryptophan/tyrosine transport system permease protein